MKLTVAIKFIVFFMGMASFVSAQTEWFVNRSNSHDPFEDGSAAHPFDTIQKGVNAAINGDTVLVAEGVYQGAGNKRIEMLGKLITLSSLSGPSSCIIDCEDDGRGFDLNSGETAFTLISGFSVVNGYAPVGAGIRLVASSPTISNCVIQGNNATDKGGGIYADWSSASIKDCVIKGNSALNSGGGVSGGLVINCTVMSNSAMNGGGLYNTFASNCTISANTASDFGGGANLGTLRNCTVIGNTANNGGGVCDGLILNCLISGNAASDGGGSLYGTLKDSIVIGNSASNSGGGISSGVIVNSTIMSNTALYGGGLYNTLASNCIISANSVHNLSGFGGGANFGTLQNCLITGNHANNGGGTADGLIQDCQIVSNTAAWGAGSAYSTVSNCTFTGNSARDGGGGSAYGMLNNCTLSGNSADWSGGGSYGSTLNNCTLTNNSAAWGGGSANSTLSSCTLTDNSAGKDGGGVFESTLNNCSLLGNVAMDQGGGASAGILRNCTLSGNSSGTDGGGAFNVILNNCTLSGNRSTNFGGGAYSSTLSNCIVYYNDSASGANYYIASLTYSCTTPDPGGTDNITNEPAFMDFAAGNLRLSSNSPCINAGTNHVWMTGAVDLDGNQRIVGRIVDMGAYEFQYTSVYYVAQSNAGAFTPYSSWETAATNIQDAVDLANNGDIVLVSNGVYAAGGRVAPGGMLTNRLVVTNAVEIRSINGPDTTIIEGAVDPITGGKGTNAIRCAHLANKAALIGFTLTHGATHTTGDYGADNSGGAVWCDSTNVVVSNCVLTGNSAYYGGGAYNGTLKNCVLLSNSAVTGGGICDSDAIACIIQGNTASNWAGGIYTEHEGIIEHCTIEGNHAENFGGGMLGGPSHVIWNCRIIGNSTGDGGGGVAFLEARDCVIVSNTAYRGGGASWSTLFNCTLADNSAERGGGTFYSTVENCTVVGNHATSYGGGSIFGGIKNSILVRNTGTASNILDNFYEAQVRYCCTAPDPGDIGNITNEPTFVDYAGGNLRLLSNSPCINSGTNQDWMADAVDLDGNPRIFGGGRVDMGAYEYQGSISVIPTNWLAQYGLPIDGSDDYGDEDGDTMNNWYEWRCGTDPLNLYSLFAVERLSTDSGFPLLTWRTVYGRGYWVQRNTDLTLGSWSNLWESPVYEFDEFPEGIETIIDFTTSTNDNAHYRVLLE